MRRLTLVVVLLILGAMLTLEFRRMMIKPWPPETFSSDLDHFKYGSIGAEVNGIPFIIWRELPTIFKDRLPKGWETFGFIQEADRDVPIGISVRRYAVKRVGFTCGACHSARVSVDGRRQVVLGAPASQLDIQSYLKFLADASKDKRLTADAVFKSAEDNGRPVGWINQLIFQYFVFPRLADAVKNLSRSLVWLKNRPEHGPGRTDAGNFWRSRWGLEPERDAIVGTVDHPSVWNQQIRTMGGFHWDGNNMSITERNYSAALAGGAAEWLLERRSIKRVSDWLMTLQPPKYPADINIELVKRGQKVYQDAGCAGCHDHTKGKVGTVTQLSEVGTDPDRTNLFDAEMVKYFGDVGKLYSWRFKNYRVTDGYANMPLDGIWMRSPYLHNGSVPTLFDLLETPDKRPATFFRGCEEFDTKKVGFDCKSGFRFDTSKRGNLRIGHLYGTNLSAADKSALLEYLKTL